MSDDRIDHEPWPTRAALLLGLGILGGIVFDALIRNGRWSWTNDPLHLSAAWFVAVGGLSFAFTLERLRWWWSILFAVGCGLVAAGITYWNDEPDGWRIASLLLALIIAAPLFQVVRDEGRWRIAQQPLHAHVWSNLILWFAAWLFVLIVFLLALLLGQLFALTGLHFLEKLLEKSWFEWGLGGGALGAGIGLLRDRDKVLGVLQKVATVVLSFLTPIIALGLGFFLLVLPFTGLDPLWKTSETTPILLSCALVAFIFANATIGNSAEEEPRNKVLRYGALVLALVVVPLAAIAVVSIGLRIGQHGLTPDRLWAAICVSVALIYGLLYWLALARGRSAWPERVRGTNVWLALGVCVIAAVLATPLVNFGAISTHDQVARLTSGKISPDEFDWRALAFDFGPSGRNAAEQLKRSGPTQAIRTAAADALSYGSKWSAPGPGEAARRREALAKARVLPKPVALPPELSRVIQADYRCSAETSCVVYYEAGADFAVVVGQPSCINQPAGAAITPCSVVATPFYRRDNRWLQAYELPDSGAKVDPQAASQVQQGWKEGTIEVRPVARRQVFVGGRPVGQAFD
jgi:uncharacterized protein DUF4153